MNMKKVLVINGSRNYVSKGYKIISKIQKGLDSNKFESRNNYINSRYYCIIFCIMEKRYKIKR